MGEVLGDVLDRCLFIDLPKRTADRDRLWAIDLVLRSPAAGAVFADGCGFDMAATRRLQLAAEAAAVQAGAGDAFDLGARYSRRPTTERTRQSASGAARRAIARAPKQPPIS